MPSALPPATGLDTPRNDLSQERAVEIAVIEGRFHGAPDVCTLIARQASILVETSQPVEDREVIPLADPELN